MNRRQFLKKTVAASALLGSLGSFRIAHAGESPNQKLLVGVMGCNGRGMDHIRGFLTQPNVEIAYICDVDERAMARGIVEAEKKQGRKPQGVRDFRNILDDRSVDILAIAAPNHWHAPATILACAAGKHVYVEKPASHNAHEAELIAVAARKSNRIVQMGNQRRSWPAIREAVSKLHTGVIGRLTAARCWYANARGSIGRGKPSALPAWLDWSLWQGPATERPFLDNVVHYNWHWRWHWGGGELANNGIHALDLARWGLQVDYPRRVSCIGGRYHFEDDQETPDTAVAAFDFGHCTATWEGSSCLLRKDESLPFVEFYGDKGSLSSDGTGYKIFDPNGKPVEEDKGSGGDAVHMGNFVDSIRNSGKPNSDIADCAKSDLLCHLGNIAYRTGQTLAVDQKTGRILGNKTAEKLWKREYRKGWEPKV